MTRVLVTWNGGARFAHPMMVPTLVAAHGVVTVHVGWRAILTACWQRLQGWLR